MLSASAKDARRYVPYNAPYHYGSFDLKYFMISFNKKDAIMPVGQQAITSKMGCDQHVAMPQKACQIFLQWMEKLKRVREIQSATLMSMRQGQMGGLAKHNLPARMLDP